MNATPATVAAAHTLRMVREAAPRPAYSTWTGKATAIEARRDAVVVEFYEDEAHCFVCGRHTDHAGEHDGLVAAGMAVYEGGNVWKTDRYDEIEASAIVDAEVDILMSIGDLTTREIVLTGFYRGLAA